MWPTRLFRGLRYFSVTRGGVSLYEASSLGIDKYVEARKSVAIQFQNPEKYRMKMYDFITDNSKSPIFTDDLKNMAYLCSKNDIKLVETMIKKYDSQNREMRFGNYIFGPVIMRMYHHLDEANAAFAIFQELKKSNFFDQIITFNILMDLLYKHEKYDSVLSVFEHVVEKQIRMMKYPKNCVNLVLASCYKQNTKESLEYAMELWTKLISYGHNVSRKSLCFFAGLAINQNKPHVALEAFSVLRSHKYISVLNLKVAALSELKRLDDVMPLLRSILEIDEPKEPNPGFTADIINRIQCIINESYTNTSIEREFNQILKGLYGRKLIAPITIDSILCKQIMFTPNIERNMELRSSFQNYQRNVNKSPLRNGLKQMY